MCFSARLIAIKNESICVRCDCVQMIVSTRRMNCRKLFGNPMSRFNKVERDFLFNIFLYRIFLFTVIHFLYIVHYALLSTELKALPLGSHHGFIRIILRKFTARDDERWSGRKIYKETKMKWIVQCIS